jgi:hypothetical protein
LEETITLENETKEIKNSVGMAISSNRAFGGIVTLWDEKLCNLDVSLCANHCILIVLKNKYFGIKFSLINIYMPNRYSEKLDCWYYLFAMKDYINLDTTIVGGDFNSHLHSRERKRRK